MNSDPLKYISQFRKKKVLVIGDIMLDEYIGGTAERISPEAPIPVLLQKSVRYILGGAGNVAANVAALGGQVTLMGLVGADERARHLSQLAKKASIATRFLTDIKRPTTTKIRFVVGSHQLVRMDIEDSRLASASMTTKLVTSIKALPHFDIVIISDYAKGCVGKKVVDALRKRFGNSAIIADMKPTNASLYKNILAITPNLKETAELTDIHATTSALADRAAKTLQENYNTSIVLTRGEYGVTALEKTADASTHFAAKPLTVHDVTGAGDTLVAVFALMMAAGAPFLDAAEMANVAAGVVVGVGGTHALTRKEIEERLTKNGIVSK
jgi:rfaE bifunctional protein kinase chain/domain